MSDQPVRFGLVGFGAWGQHHANAIRVTDGAELVAIAARSQNSLDAAKEAYPDVAVYSDFRELVARDDLDFVDVVVPSHLHHEVASAVLQGGKHLLLEKPMGISLDECDDMIRLAKENGRMFAVGHELRLSHQPVQTSRFLQALILMRKKKLIKDNFFVEFFVPVCR